MDAILLAGGKGTRMQPLTATIPKPLLRVQGRAILEWTLLHLPAAVDHVIVVAHYLHEQVETYMREQFICASYEVVEQQPKPLGTGHAVQCARPFLQSSEFLVLNGDDLYSPTALAELAAQPLGILGAQRESAASWGVLVKADNGRLQRIHEKPPEGLYPLPVLVNAGAYKFDRRIFEFPLHLSARGEYEITDYVTALAGVAPVQVVPSGFWHPIGTPADLDKAQQLPLASNGA